MEIFIVQISKFMDFIHVIIPYDGILILPFIVVFRWIFLSFFCVPKNIQEEILMCTGDRPGIFPLSID